MKIAQGYRYAAVYAGIRKQEKDDLALIVPESPASAAAVFTTNQVQAAPVRVAKKHLRASRGIVQGVLINAGNANCATRTGDAVALASCEAVAKKLKCPVDQVVPASTGVIGVELDQKLITDNVGKLVPLLAPQRFVDVSRAIMTTDLQPKVANAEIPYRTGAVHITGMAKGSGMIHPLMATTLAFVMTDAAIKPKYMKEMLVQATERSFHRLTVDGDTSTNDMILLLANGASGVTPDENGRKIFQEVLCWVLEDLAEMIARDGEGARKLITIHVAGAPTPEAAERLARAIANSPLVKTAIGGGDPNWGRILSAAGTAGVEFDPSKIEIHLQRTKVCEGGVAAEFSEADLKRKLDSNECLIRFEIKGKGKAQTRFWTCDLTEGYIQINGSYRT